MRDADHTREPWHLHPSGRSNILGSWTVYYGLGESTHNQVCQADYHDARLIAAAPDLLAACEAVLDDTTPIVEAIAACRAAVAKARGEVANGR